MVDSDSEEQPKKKKAMKKLVLVKPNTRSAYQQFRSDADEVTALLRTLEAQLEGNEEIPQVEIEDLRTEIRGMPKELVDKQTTVRTVLPRLRRIATIVKLEGATKTSKGKWLYSEEIRAGGKEISRAKEKPDPTPTSQDLTSDPKSPNLLESSQESEPPGENEQNEESQEETKDESQESTQQTMNANTRNLESNPYYDLASANKDNSSESSNKEDENQEIPPQQSFNTQDEEEEEEEHLNMFTIAARAKQDSDVFKEKVKSGLRELE
jgi:hypothetical protein